jgi:putative addiction module component (TIGR02574 family)
MARSVPIPPPGFDDLPVDEQIDYVQSLWDRIAAKPDEVPVPEWHKQALDERLESYRSNPDEGKSWDEVREQARRKLRDSSK